MTEPMTEQETGKLIARLAESIMQDLTPWGYLDPRDLGIGDSPNFVPAGGAVAGQAFLDRRRKGELLPVYLTEQQLTITRRRIRALVYNNENALNAVNQRLNYAIGTGLTYTVSPCTPECPPDLVHTTQAVVDAFTSFNEMAMRESEAHRRVDVEGEAFYRLFPQSNGLLAVRFIEPEHVTSPVQAESEDSFGVRVSPGDIEHVLGYWVKANSDGSRRSLMLVRLCISSMTKPHLQPSEDSLRSTPSSQR